jgi:hypothetical protein
LITAPLVMRHSPRWTLRHRRRGGDEHEDSDDDDEEEEEEDDSMAAHLWSPATELAATMVMAAIVFD